MAAKRKMAIECVHDVAVMTTKGERMNVKSEADGAVDGCKELS